MRISSQQIQQNYSTLSQGIKNIPQDFSIQLESQKQNINETLIDEEIQTSVDEIKTWFSSWFTYRLEDKQFLPTPERVKHQLKIEWGSEWDSDSRKFGEDLSSVYNNLYTSNQNLTQSDFKESVAFLENKMNEVLKIQFKKEPDSKLTNSLICEKAFIEDSPRRLEITKEMLVDSVENLIEKDLIRAENSEYRSVRDWIQVYGGETGAVIASFGKFFAKAQDILSPTDKKAVLESLSKMELYWDNNWKNDWEHMLSDSNQESLQNFIQRGANIGSEVDTTKTLFEMFNVTSSESNKKPTQDLESKKQEILSKVKEIKADSQGSLLSQMLSKKA
ncbi:hypothetical protein CCZ01_04080 [Helicobacter monodelphidis]|uniref:hypothetical protein n=1 Tax=Helicobacter sp. 15-1451 TaxID=2004995 RepID=UPI000DCEC1B8|nr:hypothetical protein [Helicobacter sp. 15-1451]RAX57998.1 hypothetical protein CCZ01_04080 [Helicobacter sp. 15-1451]